MAIDLPSWVNGIMRCCDCCGTMLSDALRCVDSTAEYGVQDPIYKGIRLPLAFWKIIAYVRTDGSLATGAYILEQGRLIQNLLQFEAAFDRIVTDTGHQLLNSMLQTAQNTVTSPTPVIKTDSSPASSQPHFTPD